MKHAGPQTLAQLEPLLVKLRAVAGLVERKPGTFYLRSSAFLHFHEDPAGVFADVKLQGSSFERLHLRTLQDHAALVKAVAAAVESRAKSPRLPKGAP
jgi:hypothetical protein